MPVTKAQLNELETKILGRIAVYQSQLTDATMRDESYRKIARFYSELDQLFSLYCEKFPEVESAEKSLAYAKEARDADNLVADKSDADLANLNSDLFNLATSHRMLAVILQKSAADAASYEKVIVHAELAMWALEYMPEASCETKEHKAVLRTSQHCIAKSYLQLALLESPNDLYPCAARKLLQAGIKSLNEIPRDKRSPAQHELMTKLTDTLNAVMTKAVVLHLHGQEGNRKRNFFTFFCMQPEFVAAVCEEENRDNKRQKITHIR
jgi:hypothetical protein